MAVRSKTTAIVALTRAFGLQAIWMIRFCRLRFSPVMVVAQQSRSRGPVFAVTRESRVSP